MYYTHVLSEVNHGPCTHDIRCQRNYDWVQEFVLAKSCASARSAPLLAAALVEARTCCCGEVPEFLRALMLEYREMPEHLSTHRKNQRYLCVP